MNIVQITRTFAVALVLVLTATGLWASPAAEQEPAAAMEKEMVTDPTTGEMAEAPRYGGTITYVISNEGDNADVLVAGPWGGMFINGVLEKLSAPNWGIDRTEYDFTAVNATPLFALTGQLAESWSQPDPLTYIVKVRQGVHWHDKPPMSGRELTAKDIEFNFHRLMGLGSGFTEPTTFTQILKKVAFESITATDGSTVVFKLNQPHLNALAGIIDDWIAYMYPPEVIEQHGDATDWNNLVGTGPFMLTDRVAGSSITWDKNPDYWGTDEKYPQNRLPYVDQVRALIMPEAATYLAALRSGTVDYLGHPTPIGTIDQAERVQQTNPEIEQRQFFTASITSTGLNVNNPPFDDVRVRQAMQMALDLDTINQAFFQGLAKTTPHGQAGDDLIGFMIPFEEWPEEVKKGYMYDLEGAERLLDEAGYPRDADGTRFKTVYTFLELRDLNFTELLASYWREIGVDVEIDVHPLASFVAVRKDHDFAMISHEMAYGSLSDPLNPPGRFIDVPWNSAAVSDPDYDALFEAAGAATTIEEQQRLVKAMDMYAIERHWCVWGPMAPLFEANQPWLKGYNGEGRSGSGAAPRNWLFARVWIDQELKKSMGR